MLFQTPYMGKHTTHITTLSCCMPVSIGHPVSLLKLKLNDHAMVWWICNISLKDPNSSDSLLEKLGINNIKTLLQYNQLQLFGHVTRNDGCINNITTTEVDIHHGRGRSKKTWRDTMNNDLKNWKLTRVDPANRIEWNSELRKKLRTNVGAVQYTLSETSMLNE